MGYIAIYTRDTSLLTSLQNKLRERREQSRFATIPGTDATITSPVRSASVMRNDNLL